MTKTEFLLIGSKQRLLNPTAKATASVNQFPINQASTVKSLGVHIDENLTWECHVSELSKKIASGISAIKRIRHTFPYKTLLTIYTIRWSNLFLISAARRGDPALRVPLKNHKKITKSCCMFYSLFKLRTVLMNCCEW